MTTAIDKGRNLGELAGNAGTTDFPPHEPVVEAGWELTMKWFMSYAAQSQSYGPVSFGCCITEEKPLWKIARWNREYKDRIHVLLSYAEIGKSEFLPDGNYDFEITGPS